MFLGAGARSKSSVRQKLVKALAASITAVTPADASVTPVKLNTLSVSLGSMINGEIVPSVAGNALTLALKTLNAVDPSASDPIYLVSRNASVSNGVPNIITLTSAQSITISSGSTLGAANNVAFRIWLVMFDDAGTPRLGVINCTNGQFIYPLGQLPITNSTAEGGAGGADSSLTFYTGTAVTAKAYTIIGYVTYESGLATAGTWNTGPTRIQVYDPSVPLPGAIVQRAESRSAAVATGTTVLPIDNTIPQNTEGDQYLSASLAPSSAANLLSIDSQINAASSGATGISIALFQDSVANALAANTRGNWGAGVSGSDLLVNHTMIAGTTSSTTFKIRAGPSAAATVTFNGAAGTNQFNGTMGSFLRILELMT